MTAQRFYIFYIPLDGITTSNYEPKLNFQPMRL